jgi:hypothetical protein
VTLAALMVADRERSFLESNGFAEDLLYVLTGEVTTHAFRGIWTEGEGEELERDRGMIWLRSATVLASSDDVSDPARTTLFYRASAPAVPWCILGIQVQSGGLIRLRLTREEPIEKHARRVRVPTGP